MLGDFKRENTHKYKAQTIIRKKSKQKSNKDAVEALHFENQIIFMILQDKLFQLLSIRSRNTLNLIPIKVADQISIFQQCKWAVSPHGFTLHFYTSKYKPTQI